MRKLGLLLLAAAFTTACNSRFSRADVEKAEADIRTQYENQGYTVEQVNLVKESDRRLSGFVKIRKDKGIFNKPTLTKNCVATLDEDAARYIWECK